MPKKSSSKEKQNTSEVRGRDQERDNSTQSEMGKQAAKKKGFWAKIISWFTGKSGKNEEDIKPLQEEEPSVSEAEDSFDDLEDDLTFEDNTTDDEPEYLAGYMEVDPSKKLGFFSWFKRKPEAVKDLAMKNYEKEVQKDASTLSDFSYKYSIGDAITKAERTNGVKATKDNIYSLTKSRFDTIKALIKSTGEMRKAQDENSYNEAIQNIESGKNSGTDEMSQNEARKDQQIKERFEAKQRNDMTGAGDYLYEFGADSIVQINEAITNNPENYNIFKDTIDTLVDENYQIIYKAKENKIELDAIMTLQSEFGSEMRELAPELNDKYSEESDWRYEDKNKYDQVASGILRVVDFFLGKFKYENEGNKESDFMLLREWGIPMPKMEMPLDLSQIKNENTGANIPEEKVDVKIPEEKVETIVSDENIKEKIAENNNLVNNPDDSVAKMPDDSVAEKTEENIKVNEPVNEDKVKEPDDSPAPVEEDDDWGDAENAKTIKDLDEANLDEEDWIVIGSWKKEDDMSSIFNRPENANIPDEEVIKAPEGYNPRSKGEATPTEKTALYAAILKKLNEKTGKA